MPLVQSQNSMSLTACQVCAQSTNNAASNISCRELGYSGGYTSSSWADSSSNTFVLDYLNCKGDETELTQCAFTATANYPGACNQEVSSQRSPDCASICCGQ